MSSYEDTTDEAMAGAALAAQKSSPALLHGILFVVLGVVILALPRLGLYPFFLSQVLCFALFACAFNMLLGFGGLLSFGHAMFFGFAAYICAFMAKNGIAQLGIPPLTPELAIISGAAVAAFLGLITGSLAIRRQGIYFAMITLALAQMIYFFSLQAPFTGGENGIQAVPRGSIFGLSSLPMWLPYFGSFNISLDLTNDLTLYYFVAVVFFAGLLFIYRIIHSPFGQVLKAIRENEPRAISLGFQTNRYKLLVFILSATLAGVAGATKAIVVQLATLTDVHWTMSGEVILMTLVGGMGTIFGPVVGAVIIIAIQNYLANLGDWVTIVQGLIFVICVLLFKEGVVGLIARITGRPL